MSQRPNIARRLYQTLLRLYPRAFRERFGESMQQTFDDICRERHPQATLSHVRVVFWLCSETALGAIHERLRLMTEGVMMQGMLKTLGSSALLGLLCIVPLIIMEVVNRRSSTEAFPFALFFILWLNLFAISIVLLPIALGGRRASHYEAESAPSPGDPPLTNPRSAALLSVALILVPAILPLLDSVGWLSLDRLFNGPNPEVAYLPGQILSLGLIVFPVAAGVIAGRPIVHTLRTKGSLLAHPLHLLFVVGITFLFGMGVVGLIVDQWPCFMGVPNCD
jgi:hypothetical protein